MTDLDVVVIGAGPGGLAAAAALRARGRTPIVVDKAAAVGNSWRGHYDRLHLHTPRRLSGLPGLPIPRSMGRWVSRDDVVRYLEAYAAHHRLDLRLGHAVTGLERVDGRWRVRLDDGTELEAPDVVIATGYNHTPVDPAFPGLEGYTGELLHASRYRNGAPYAGKDVLVVGIGNSGAEIATDLAEHGAASVRIAVRTPPYIIRRTQLGWPAQATGILVRRLPPRAVDAIAQRTNLLECPDLSEHGLPRPTAGLYSRLLEGSVPVQDVGIIDSIRSGAVHPVATISHVEGESVHLVDGTTLTPDAIILATGYRQGLETVVGHLGVLDDRGLPVVHGPQTSPRAPGLWFTGYTNPISGMFRELRIDAERIAAALAP